MSALLIKNALLLATADEQLGDIAGADILVEGGEIKAVGKNISAPGARLFDASSCLVLPAFVNTHHHLYQALTRALVPAQQAKLFDWLVYHYEIWRHLRAEDLYAAARAALAELLLSGCCCSADHHYLVPRHVEDDYFQAEAEAAESLGIRLVLTRGSMSLGRSRGGLPPDQVVQDEDEILADCERVVSRLHQPEPFALRRVALAPCSPFSVSPELMRRSAELARKLNVRLHTHLAETLDEEKFCLEKFGCRPVRYAEELGWLGPDVWFAHCVYLNHQEIKQLARTGTGVAHCPVSNLRLGSGIAPVPAMLRAGVPVGLAVDGSASNDASSMMREASLALLVHRVGTAVDAMDARLVLRMLAVGGARVLGMEKLGRVAPGMAADLTLFDMEDLAFAGAWQDPLAALFFCWSGQRPRMVLVDGRVVVEDGHLVGQDEREIFEKARVASRRLLSAAGATI